MSDSLDKLSWDAVLLEYTKAANPLAMGTISKVPYKTFPRALYEHSQTAMIPLDVSDVLQVDAPATSPALCANYVKILAGASLSLNINATSVLFYVMWGAGTTQIEGSEIPWQTGDFVALPVTPHIHFQAQQESVLYLVHDEPLLRYLGARAEIPQFEPTLYTSETTLRELKKVQQEGEGTNRNRISILLMNRVMDQTLTVTHTLWAMLGVLPKGAVQLPHRHQSVDSLLSDKTYVLHSCLGSVQTSKTLSSSQKSSLRKHDSPLSIRKSLSVLCATPSLVPK